MPQPAVVGYPEIVLCRTESTDKPTDTVGVHRYLIAFETNNETYDVILIPPLAIVVGPDGLDQYDYTDVATTGELVLLSHLDVVKPLTPASNMR